MVCDAPLPAHVAIWLPGELVRVRADNHPAEPISAEASPASEPAAGTTSANAQTSAGLGTTQPQQTRYALARDSGTPAEVLESLLEPPAGASSDPGSEELIRIALAANESCPQNLLSMLASDTSASVRAAVAGNVASPEAALHQLAEDWNTLVIWKLAANPQTPTDVLERLAAVGDVTIRVLVAGNPRTPSQCLRTLLTDTDIRVRLSAADNASAPDGLLQALSTEARRDPAPENRRALARATHVDPEVLTALAQDSELMVRATLAANPSLPRSTFELMWAEAAIRPVLAENPACPPELRSKTR